MGAIQDRFQHYRTIVKDMGRKKSQMTESEEQDLRKNPVNEFTCCGKTMVYKEFREHLLNEHKLVEASLKGKKSLLMHMDGSQWFSYNYQWELETGLRFTQYTMMARDKDDPMRYDD